MPHRCIQWALAVAAWVATRRLFAHGLMHSTQTLRNSVGGTYKATTNGRTPTATALRAEQSAPRSRSGDGRDNSDEQRLADTPALSRSYQHAVQVENDHQQSKANKKPSDDDEKKYTIAYRYQPPRGTGAGMPALVLLHPAGIGLSSWFWQRFMASMADRADAPAVYAVNLLGCGVSEGSDAWDEQACGPISDRLPLMWVEAVENLIHNQILSSSSDSSSSSLDLPFGRLSKTATVVTQGASAPIGILLAQRNPKTVARLVMASPPVWKDLAVASKPRAVRRSMSFFDSPRWGRLAFRALETRRAVRTFSNLFLFAKKCDEIWLDCAMTEADRSVRPPIVAVNSGVLTLSPLKSALRSMSQPLLLLVGEVDNKARPRPEFAEEVPCCDFVILPGRNVLPWEYPGEVVDAILGWLGDVLEEPKG